MSPDSMSLDPERIARLIQADDLARIGLFDAWRAAFCVRQAFETWK